MRLRNFKEEISGKLSKPAHIHSNEKFTYDTKIMLPIFPNNILKLNFLKLKQ